MRFPHVRFKSRLTAVLVAGVPLLAAIIPGARADEPRGAVASELILRRFAIDKAGNELLVPVRVAGKDRLFVVDTGATHTLVDLSVPLGEPREVVTVNTADRVAEVKVFTTPQGASVGGLPLDVDTVAGADLRRLREVSGYAVEGLLGMDFLGRYVVRVDFDRGELLLLRSAPGDSGVALPMSWEPSGLPGIDAAISPGKRLRFLIDTGAITLDSGEVEILEMRTMVRRGEFREVGRTLGLSLSGGRSARLFQGDRLSLGQFAVERPLFTESPRHSLLGLGFWSRFVVTFDFPGHRVYLRAGEGYDRPDRRDMSGLHLLLKQGAVVVEVVDGGSPGAKAGVRPGDVLLSLDGLSAKDASLSQLRAALRLDGRRTCEMRRGSDFLTVTIEPPN